MSIGQREWWKLNGHPLCAVEPDCCSGTYELWRLLWHNDGAYVPKPGIATSLWAETISPGATPTQFANAVEIVDRLPADLL